VRNTQPALTVHIAQFAALLRDRQVAIAFHEGALFDYLTLELHRPPSASSPTRRSRAGSTDHLESCSAAGSTGPAAPSPLRSGLLLKTDFIENMGEPPNPMASCDAPHVARAARRGGRGALVRPSASHAFRECRPKEPVLGPSSRFNGNAAAKF
jgi:hypothetical protein